MRLIILIIQTVIVVARGSHFLHRFGRWSFQRGRAAYLSRRAARAGEI